jgi:hypothetical protein
LIIRQARNGEADAVLHQHLGHVEIDALVKRHGQVVRAVVSALARHVHHAFDAVDVLLDRRRHRLRDILGAGPRINGRDRNRRRRDARKLRERQLKNGDRPAQRDNDGQHRGKDRPIDEETREHGAGLLNLGRTRRKDEG